DGFDGASEYDRTRSDISRPRKPGERPYLSITIQPDGSVRRVQRAPGFDPRQRIDEQRMSAPMEDLCWSGRPGRIRVERGDVRHDRIRVLQDQFPGAHEDFAPDRHHVLTLEDSRGEQGLSRGREPASGGDPPHDLSVVRADDSLAE